MPATLADALLRHQVYLEGLKAGETRRLNNAFLRELDTAVREELQLIPFERLDSLSRKGLGQLVTRIMRRQRAIFAKFKKNALDDLKDYVEAERQLARSLYSLTGKSPRVVGFDRLWRAINARKIVANNGTLAGLFRTMEASQAKALQTAIRAAYSDGKTRQELFDLIRGLKGRAYRDGLLNKFGNQGRTAVSTAFQQAKAVTHDLTAAGSFDRYRWISVLDTATTEICRHRNNLVFQYGKGPLPPAHYNCRSSTAPLTDEASTSSTDSFFEWISDQPDAFLRDIYGERRAKELRTGKAKPADYAHFDGIGSLTLERFKSKSRLMRL